MGSKGDSGAYEFEQASPATDIMEGIGGMMEEQSMMTQLMMNQQAQNTEMMLNSMNSTVPEVTDYTEFDYDTANSELQAKIDQQITDEETKRSGVLGTILSNEDDDPDTVTSSLLIGS